MPNEKTLNFDKSGDFKNRKKIIKKLYKNLTKIK